MKYTPLLVNAVQTSHRTELFMMFIHSHLRRHMYAPQGDMKTMFVSQAIDTVCNEQSVELRRRFGVFDDV